MVAGVLAEVKGSHTLHQFLNTNRERFRFAEIVVLEENAASRWAIWEGVPWVIVPPSRFISTIDGLLVHDITHPVLVRLAAREDKLWRIH